MGKPGMRGGQARGGSHIFFMRAEEGEGKGRGPIRIDVHRAQGKVARIRISAHWERANLQSPIGHNCTPDSLNGMGNL